MSRQQAFEAIYAKQHDVPAESLVQYRHKSKDGYNLPGIASHYRTYCEVMDSEDIQGLRKDAERYRWIMENLDVRSDGDYLDGDADVDAAMSKGDKP